MILLPLVVRELRVAVRRPSSYRIRMTSGTAGICISMWALLVWGGWTSGAALGMSILRALALVGFVGTLLAGVILAADSLSQEKREATLSLLLLTDLKPRELVLGKLAAKIVIPLYALIGMLPGFAVCSVVGGVTPGEFWRLLLVLANTLFLSLSAGLLASSFCQQQRAAYGSALLLILLCSVGIPFSAGALAASSGQPVWDNLAALLSPTGSYRLAFDKRYASESAWYWSSLASTHLLAWLSLGLACRFVERHARSESEIFPQQNKTCTGRSSARVVGAQTSDQPHHDDKLRDSHPIAWLASRHRAVTRLIWSLPAAAAWLWVTSDLNPLGNYRSKISFLVWFLVHTLFKVWVAGDVAHAFASDRRSGALELLLGTPLHVGDIGAGMLRAFRYRFARPILALCFLDVLLALRLLVYGEKTSAFLVSTGAAMFVMDCYSLCWVGLWRSLVSLHSPAAVVGTIWRILVLPWIWIGMLVGVFGQSTAAELTIAWSLLTVVNNLVFARSAKRNLHEHFRVMALRPFGEKAPHIESEWSAMNWEPELSHPQ